jgi:hypothetical protein
MVYPILIGAKSTEHNPTLKKWLESYKILMEVITVD